MPASKKLSTKEAYSRLSSKQKEFAVWLKSKGFSECEYHPGADISGGLTMRHLDKRGKHHIKLTFSRGNYFRAHGFQSETRLREMRDKYEKFFQTKNPEKAGWGQPASASFVIRDALLEDVGRDLVLNMLLSR